MKTSIVSFLLSLLLAAPLVAFGADAERRAEVAKLGADVMPFDLKATTHIFTKTKNGGTQRVVAKDLADAQQVKLVRAHLTEIKAQFERGDFSGPTHIHGQQMPGLEALRAAKPGQIAMAYQQVTGGAEITYKTTNVKLVVALHQWFDAQVSDHGADAMAGHQHHHSEVKQ